MKAIEAAYIAGIMDGEGSFYVERAKRRNGGFRYRIVVSVMMCEKSAIDFIGKATGKKPVTKKLSRAGLTRRDSAYYLTWRNRPAEALLRTILPYLKGKRRQAELCIRFQERVAKPLGIHFAEKDFAFCETIRLKVSGLNNGFAIRC